ncbi:hypothetical protein CSA56_07560 [candidate division KSB3 bacterium]|uniref:Aldehyde oxidase/xanthine dehydrogenase second molybdopterin binding domain-containing protein n=1 Tax=candidate division KSB3 bacterium TaxID=2044937 RepID=A0A2G6KFS3_9BACT|nr:MAG: hypothetical protein CSA56_07560 [candidate division KSB3 bacterium]
MPEAEHMLLWKKRSSCDPPVSQPAPIRFPTRIFKQEQCTPIISPPALCEDSAGARGEIIAGGRLLLNVGSVDMGQGADPVMTQIASETIGWPYSRISVQAADTKRDPLAGMTTASESDLR